MNLSLSFFLIQQDTFNRSKQDIRPIWKKKVFLCVLLKPCKCNAYILAFEKEKVRKRKMALSGCKYELCVTQDVSRATFIIFSHYYSSKHNPQ